ncbi:hypothetical protein ACFL2D_02845 [Patescibacteria group bacterium]
MANPQLTYFVEQAFDRSYSRSKTISLLEKQGWDKTDIEEAVAATEKKIQTRRSAPLTPPKPPKRAEWNANINLSEITASQVLLFLGALIVVLAGAIYIGIGWSQWTPLSRIIAIFLPTVICYGVGMSLWAKAKHKKEGAVFITVGSLLFPFFLVVFFKQLELFETPYNYNFILTTSFFTFIQFLILALLLKFSVFILLYQVTFIVMAYSFVRTIGVGPLRETTSLAWIFSVIGLAYLFLEILYKKYKQKTAGQYSFIIGVAILFISATELLFASMLHNRVVWLALLLGMAYFCTGLLLESYKRKTYAHVLYVAGVYIGSFSFIHLCGSTKLITHFVDFPHADKFTIAGWAFILVGLLYLLIGFLLSMLRKYGLEGASNYRPFFSNVGPIVIILAVFALGLDGHKIGYETALLLLSLGYIFGSIPGKRRLYLLTGTLFLVIYIFSIAGEYFQDEVGWPLALFFAGMLSMGISVLMERIRRKYFAQPEAETKLKS